jgi:hypothetical protein
MGATNLRIVGGFFRHVGHSCDGILADVTDLSHLSGEAPIDLLELRERLRKMTDKELRRFGEAARHMCSPKANHGDPPRQVFVIQLEEARGEWKRRHPKKVNP